ncbi:hypothetical protein KC362_g77 [Hortaea werneckii]|nr:hypothetical protein KC362_g77 [Hortaea werneckii]
MPNLSFQLSRQNELACQKKLTLNLDACAPPPPPPPPPEFSKAFPYPIRGTSSPTSRRRDLAQGGGEGGGLATAGNRLATDAAFLRGT